MSTDTLDRKATLSLTDDMFFTLRLTDTNGLKYWSVKPLVAALAATEQQAIDATARQVKLEALSQHVGELDSSLNEARGKLVRLIEATGEPDALFGPHARAYLADNYLSRTDVLPYKSVVLGQNAGEYCGNLGTSVLLGAGAGLGALNAFTNYVALGAQAQPLASYSVTLGNTQTQTFAAGSVATRADKRDFTDEQELSLGLDFVLKLKPKLALMDLREDYIAYADMPYPPAPLEPEPKKPTVSLADPDCANIWAAYRAEYAAWVVKNTAFHKAMDAWRPAYAAWKKANALSAVVRDGSHKRAASRTLLFADDLAEAASQLGSFFTGIEDSAVNGGMDVKSVRLEEMVPVLVKAVQELHAELHGDAFVERVATRLFEKSKAARDALRSTPTP